MRVRPRLVSGVSIAKSIRAWTILGHIDGMRDDKFVRSENDWHMLKELILFHDDDVIDPLVCRGGF